VSSLLIGKKQESIFFLPRAQCFSSAKQRITVNYSIPLHGGFARNLFPKPSPLLAPFTSPAIVYKTPNHRRLGFPLED